MKQLNKVLVFFEIDKKLFDIVTNNTSNNNTLKKKLKKVLNRKNIIWNKVENSIFCIVYIVNLVVQNFIKVIDSSINNDAKIFEILSDFEF